MKNLPKKSGKASWDVMSIREKYIFTWFILRRVYLDVGYPFQQCKDVSVLA